ncbi:MFS transporter [Paenibacillus kobensis]|uniref:MFS transporter n=1 Tax=Paenibacillus kobensis TaxID=59841 RepID=UPI001FE6B42E|nr:MFS transporter [Paenibacillus kobensis]
MNRSGMPSWYKWVVLLSIVPIVVSTEMMWLSLAPVSTLAEQYYGVSSLSITLCSMSFMIMFVLFSVPASWVIDRFGYRASLITGALITAVFGMLRAVFADQFELILIMQFAVAIGQPFLLNITTKVAANWFPVSERSTAAGILTLAQYVGFVVPMAIAPVVAERSGIPDMFMLFAIVAAVSAVIAIVLTREAPAGVKRSEQAGERLHAGSLKQLVANRGYMLILIISFVSIGIFNTILTLLESIVTPRGLTSEQAGIVGAVFIVAGIIGAVILPVLSDKFRVRVPFFIGAIAVLIPAYAGLTFARGELLLAGIAGIAGFMIMGAAPILFQHGSEAAYPIPEGASLGFILLMGQISGTAFVYLFETTADAFDSIVWPMLAFVVMTAALLPLAFRMKESAVFVRPSSPDRTAAAESEFK